MFRINAPARIVVIALGLGLAAMLCASLYKRFTEPDLTVRRFSALAQEPAPANMGEMEAVGRLMRDVAANPRDKETALRLVEGLMAMGQWEAAENFAQKALALDGPDDRDARPMYLLALIHHNQGRHAQAAELLEKVLEKSETAPARYSLGILYLHYLNNPKAGIAHLQKGLQDPGASESLRGAMREELEKAAGFEEKFAPAGEENQPLGDNGQADAP